MLLRIPALLSAEDVRQCRQALEQADWQDGRTTAGFLAAQVKNNLQLPLDSATGKTLGSLILDRLGHHPLYLSAALPSKVLPPRFNRYEGGGTYGNHIDNALFTIPGTASRRNMKAASWSWKTPSASRPSSSLQVTPSSTPAPVCTA